DLGNQVFGADRRRLHRTGGAHAAHAVRTRSSLEEFSVSSRSIGPSETHWPLAGVLLGKTSLNSLYGLKGGLPRTATRFRLSGQVGLAGPSQWPAPAPN